MNKYIQENSVKIGELWVDDHLNQKHFIINLLSHCKENL